MSCPNFKSMQNFSLFVRTDDEIDEAYFIGREIECSLDEVNDSLTFHKIILDGGHYYGLQFFVEEKHDPNEMDNYECQYYFDMFRSVAIRRYNSEINKINRMLRRMAKEWGFEEIYCAAVFGNGEAVYAPVRNNPRARIAQAVSPVY